jgi:broad specificity phosphatase PhoE
MIKDDTTIFIFRHGETDWNAASRLQGHSDIPLNENGRTQSQKLRWVFEENKIDHIFASDLSRALETAQIAAGPGSQVPISSHRELRECFLGQSEGLTHDEIRLRFGEEVWKKWTSILPEDMTFRLPGGESKLEAVTRASVFLGNALQSRKELGSVVVAVHGLLMRRWFFTLRPDLAASFMTPNCVCFQMIYDRKRKQFEMPNAEPLATGSGRSPDDR